MSNIKKLDLTDPEVRFAAETYVYMMNQGSSKDIQRGYKTIAAEAKRQQREKDIELAYQEREFNKQCEHNDI